MKKYFCDNKQCGSEITGAMIIIYKSGKRLELCYKCGEQELKENPNLKQDACYKMVV